MVLAVSIGLVLTEIFRGIPVWIPSAVAVFGAIPLTDKVLNKICR